MSASPEKANNLANPMEREVVLTRIFNAPREVVFEAWTKPEHLKHWWGPTVFTNPECQVDLRIGGAWRIVMRAPNGVDYPCEGVYREIVPPERLVFTNIAVDKEGNRLLEGLTTVLFGEHEGKTKLTLRTFAKGLVPHAPQMLAGMEAGWSQSLDKLTAQLGESFAGTPANQTSSTADREIVTTRIFDAPRELVFDVWTDPKHVAAWWGPNGFTSTIQQMDVRPGGVWRLVMHGPDGVDYQNESIFREVIRPERLVYSHVSPPQFDSTVTFEDDAGKTRLTMRMVFGTAVEREKVAKAFKAVEGAQQTFGRLAEYLSRTQAGKPI